MRALARSTIQSLAPRARANEPLAASFAQSAAGIGSGLSTQGINDWLANLFGTSQSFQLLEQYQKSVPVYFAVKIRADSLARAPLKAYRPNSRGELEWVGPTHPVQRMVSRMNPWWSQSNMWRGVETYLSLWGSSFRWLNKVGSPQDWEQWLLRPDKVRVIVSPRGRYIEGFVYDPNGANFPMMPDEVIWDRYFNPLDEFAGLSPLESLRDIISMRQDMIRTNRQLFKNGVLAQNLAFMLPGPLTNAQVDAFYARMEERHTGADQGNRPIVLDKNTSDVKNLGLSNREMEWMNGLRWAAGDMLTALGVREEMYPGSQRTTYHNLGEAERSFWRHTIAPEWHMVEDNMNEQLVPQLPPRDQNLVFRFDTLVVEGMQESIESKSTRLREDAKAGLITPDEFRHEVHGWAPLDEGLGAKPYAPSGTLPLDAIEAEEDEPPMIEPPADDDDEDGRALVYEVRCPRCSKRLPLNNVPAGSEAYCKRCNATFEVREEA